MFTFTFFFLPIQGVTFTLLSVCCVHVVYVSVCVCGYCGAGWCCVRVVRMNVIKGVRMRSPRKRYHARVFSSFCIVLAKCIE